MFIPTENIKKRYPKVILFDVESFHSDMEDLAERMLRWTRKSFSPAWNTASASANQSSGTFSRTIEVELSIAYYFL